MRDCVARCVRRYQFNFLHIPKLGSTAGLCAVYVIIFLAVYLNKHQKPERDMMAELERYYDVQVNDERLAEKFVQLNRDEGTDDFIQWSVDRSHRFFLQMFYGFTAPLLKLFTTKTAANGLLFRGEMFVFSPSQFKKLLPELFDSPEAQSFTFDSWLDLGAGDGGALVRGVTPLAKQISTTEICPVMRKRLEWRGFTVEDVMGWKNKKMESDIDA